MPGYSKRLLVARSTHIVEVIRASLPSGYEFDDVRFRAPKYKHDSRAAIMELPCIVACHRKGIAQGHEKRGTYTLYIDSFDDGRLRVTEAFDWGAYEWTKSGHNAGSTKGKRKAS